MKGVLLYKKHYNILQTEMMDAVCNQLTNGNMIDLNQPIDKINKQIDEIDCDFVVVWYFQDIVPKIKSLSNLDIPLILTSEESYNRLANDVFRKVVEYHKPDGIILQNKNTKDAFIDYLGKEYDFFWLPWGIDPDIMKDYKEEKIWDFSISGKFSKYQYRRTLNDMYKRKSYYHRIPRILPPERSWEAYARDLNKSKISLGGCMGPENVVHYKNYFLGELYSKTLEIPACNTCLINTTFSDKEELGFKDGVNFIEFSDLKEFKRKLDYYLEDEDEVKRITKNGYELVQNNYTIKQQVDRLVNEVEKIYG